MYFLCTMRSLSSFSRDRFTGKPISTGSFSLANLIDSILSSKHKIEMQILNIVKDLYRMVNITSNKTTCTYYPAAPSKLAPINRAFVQEHIHF